MTKWLLIAVAGFCLHEFLATRGTVVSNYGISFGIGQGLVGLIVLIEIMVIVVLWRIGGKMAAIGGLVNLGDRLRFGYVRDYWYLPIIGLYNNVGDWIIAVGIVGLLLQQLWKK